MPPKRRANAISDGSETDNPALTIACCLSWERREMPKTFQIEHPCQYDADRFLGWLLNIHNKRIYDIAVSYFQSIARAQMLHDKLWAELYANDHVADLDQRKAFMEEIGRVEEGIKGPGRWTVLDQEDGVCTMDGKCRSLVYLYN